MVTGQEKCSYFFLVLQKLHDTKCAQPFTHCLILSFNLGQKNSRRIMKSVLYILPYALYWVRSRKVVRTLYHAIFVELGKNN